MLKGIANGVPKDITRIAMRGKNLFDVSTVEKGRIDNGEVGYVSQTSSLTIEGTTVSFTTTAAYRGVCSGFFEIPDGTETITFNFIINEALGVKFVFYDGAKIWLNQDYTPQLANIPPATANVPSGAKYVRLSFTGQIAGGYSYTMSNIMLNSGSTPRPYEPYGMQSGWEVRDQQGAILWGADKTLTGTNSIPMKGYGLPLKGVEVEGNMVQTGTPDPTTPIWPEECGEKTVNILDSSAISQTKNGVTYTVNPDKSITIDGMLDRETADYIELYELNAKSGQAYTISGVTGFTAATLQIFTTSSSAFPAGNRLQCYDTPTTRTALADEKCYVRLYVYRGVRYENVTIFPMIVLGNDTTRPYEPYGYKIPITLNGITQNVYLDEPLRKIGDYADTISSNGTITRLVGKRILTGDESVTRDVISGNLARFTVTGLWTTAEFRFGVCSHFNYGYSNRNYGTYHSSSNTATFAYIFDNDSSTASNFKQYLKDQYDAGNPVTYWYVLVTPTTEQVTVPTLTPADGNDTLTVNTTLPPSLISITGHIKALT